MAAAGVDDDDAAARDPVEVAVEEYFAQRRRGDRSDPAEFAARVPGRADEFRRLVAALDLLESAAATVKTGGAPAAIPERIGRFRLVRRIGRGGMGTVYEAVDEELGRSVALKVLPGWATLDARAIERFRREAQAAAQLRHPHIVPLFGVGEEGGTHWIAMQLVPGASLDEVAREAAGSGRPRMEPREAARHAFALADALACAHAAGILHRDVKPSNVLLDPSGVVFITDFGLATAEGAAAITRTGETVGTPRYMAPEAFSGWADPRTDVWGVGVTLYELLAGRPAFDGSDRAQLLRQVCDVEPPALRDVADAVPRDLATIVQRCLRKEPAARYDSARDLADDLHRFLDGEPIRARPPTLADRVVSLARRHRGVAVAAGAALVALVALLGAWAFTLRRTNDRLAREQARAEENLVVASDAIEQLLDEATGDVLLRAPALDPLRRRLLEAALAFEQRLLAGQEESASKRFDVALAHLRVGAIDWELRRLDESRLHHEAAAASLRLQLAARGGTDAAVAMPLASALAGIACCARDRGDSAAAEAALREGLAVIERTTGGEPRSVDEAHHLVRTATLLADLLVRDRRAPDGEALLAATLPRVARWLDRDDAGPPAARVLRDAWVQLAEARHHAGDAPEAIATLERALAISRRLVAGADADVHDLAFDAARRSWLGSLEQELGGGPEVTARLAAARRELETIAARWPMVPEFRRDLADALVRDAVARPDDLAPEIDAQLARAIELADGALAERPDDASFAFAALRARNSFVTRRADAGDAAGAHKVAKAATAWLESRAAAIAAWPVGNVEQAAVAWQNRAVVERELGRGEEALAAATQATALAERLLAGGRAPPFAPPLLLRIGSLSGSLHAERGAPDAALAAWTEVEEEARRLLAEGRFADDAGAPRPPLVDVALLLVEALNLDANLRARRDDGAGAAARLAEARAIAARLVAGCPERADCAAALGMAQGDAGLLAARQGDPPRARAELLLALPLLQRAIERHPARRDWRRALAIALDGLAGSLEPADDEAELAALRTLLACGAAAADAAAADPFVQVEAARLFARAAAVRHGPVATRFGAPARDPWADAAMSHLDAAAAAGFADASRMERDVAFDSLRPRDDFRRWLAALKDGRR